MKLWTLAGAALLVAGPAFAQERERTDAPPLQPCDELVTLVGIRSGA